MINILLPAMGKSTFFKDSFFPKPLVEINGKTMLEQVIDNYNTLNEKNFIFVFSDQDCMEFHIDASAEILCQTSHIIKLKNQTSGALCTCLMAIKEINNDIPLIIANCDQIIDLNYENVINYFEKGKADAGVIVFPSVHPRWSYARENGGEITEVAEKRPISRNAIAGFYYFRKGKYFVEAAKNVLLKQNQLNGKYYISASINELILENKRISCYHIEKGQYHSFYSPAKIKEYEESIKK